MGLFGGSDDGCGGHHYGEWSGEGRYRIKEWGSSWNIKEEHVRQCQHEECREREREWRKVSRFPDSLWQNVVDEDWEGVRDYLDEQLDGEESDDDD